MSSARLLTPVIGAGLLLSGLPAFADNYVAGANYSNGQVYALCFDDAAGTATRSTWQADGGTKPSSLVFYTGNSDELGKEQLQLLVADSSGEILRFLWGEAYTVGEEPQKDCNAIEITPTVSVYDKNLAVGPDAPDGLSVTSDQQLISVSANGGSASSEIWRFDMSTSPADTASAVTPVPVLTNLPYTDIVESLVLPSNTTSTDLHGDLLVVTNTPSAILRVDSACIAKGAGPCTGYDDFIGGGSNVSLPAEPAGIALLPSPYQDKLLVSTRDGSIAVYDLSSGSAVLEDPALITNLGQGKFKIKTARKVAVQDEQSSRLVSFAANVYVAGRNNGSIIQTTLEVSNGVVSLAAGPSLEVNIGIEHPRGLATTSDDFIRISTCTVDCPDQVVVDISTVIEHSFDVSATTGEPITGYIGETYDVLKDPRPQCVGSSASADPGLLYIFEGQVYTYNPGANSVVIPSHLCGSPADDPHLLLIRTVSNIDPTKIELNHRAYDTDLDNDGVKDLDCFAGDLNNLPAVGWAPIPETGEDTIVEGQQIIDMITGCGSLRMKTRTLSYFVMGLRNQVFASSSKGKPGKATKTYFGTIINSEYDYLVQTLQEAAMTTSCVGDPVLLSEIYDTITGIQTDIGKGRYRKLDADTLALFAQLRDNDNNLMLAPKFQGCPKNFIGDVESRMSHLYFSTATKLLDKTWTPGCSEENLIELCLQ